MGAARTPRDSLAGSQSAVTFFAAAVLVPGIFLAVLLSGLVVAAKRGPVVQSGGSTRAIYYWIKEKDRVAQQASGSRILLFGGSGTLYSIRSEQVSATLHAPVINMGLHADLGIEYMLYRARRELRPNDVAVLLFEHHLYGSGKVGWTAADYTIPFDLPFVATLGPERAAQYVGLITPIEYLRKVYGGLSGTSYPGDQITAMLNASGDFVANRRVAQTAEHRKTLDNSPSFRNSRLDEAQARRIRDFVEWCRSRGIFVVAGFPALKESSVYGEPAQQEFTARIASMYRDMGVPLLGEADDFVFPASLFFDTNYHMHDEGAAVMTALFARRLGLILRCDLKRDWGAGIREECASKASRLMIDLRDDTPYGVVALEGFSHREPWGRWTDGTRARIRTSTPITGPFRVRLEVSYAFAERGPVVATVRAGDEAHAFTATRGLVTLDFKGASATDTLEIELPHQRSPKEAGLGEEARHIGIGIMSLEIIPRGW